MRDFPVYLGHHLISLALLAVTVFVPHTQFMGVVVLLVAESGGMLLSLYVMRRTRTALVLFVAAYGVSRALFTYLVYELVRSNRKTPGLVDDVSAYVTAALVTINWRFWCHHARKLLR